MPKHSSPVNSLLRVLDRQGRPGHTRSGNMGVKEQALSEYINDTTSAVKDRYGRGAYDDLTSSISRSRLPSGGGRGSEEIAQGLHEAQKSWDKGGKVTKNPRKQARQVARRAVSKAKAAAKEKKKSSDKDTRKEGRTALKAVRARQRQIKKNYLNTRKGIKTIIKSAKNK